MERTNPNLHGMQRISMPGRYELNKGLYSVIVKLDKFLCVSF